MHRTHRRPAARAFRAAGLFALLAATSIATLPLGCQTPPTGLDADDHTHRGSTASRADGQPVVISRQADRGMAATVIRVRLETLRGGRTLRISTAHPVTATGANRLGEPAGREMAAPEELEIEAHPDGLRVNNAVLRYPAVTLRTRPGVGQPWAFELATGNGRHAQVRGTLTIHAAPDGTLDPVIAIDMEDYVRGSLLAEMPAEFGAEALKAQAVAIRTYGLWRILENRGATGDDRRAWDVMSSVADLHYGGIRYEKPAGDAATDATRGEVLTVDGRVLLAYFHSTSGGATTPAWQYFDKFHGCPPLAGTQSPASEWSPHHQWQIDHDWADIRAAVLHGGLAREAELGGTLHAVERLYPADVDREPHPLAPDPARRPRTFVFITDNGRVEIDAVRFRMAVGGGKSSMPSTCCVIVPHDDGTVTFHGRGFGHGVGMCQYGAAGMAREGADWRRILQHYYPGARIEYRGSRR